MSENIDIIFVAWQDPAGRRFFPVARLARLTNGARRYEFSYIHGAVAASSAGFVPFVSFPDLNRAYESDDLFPFFQNRVLSRGRPDYGDYLRRLGLPATGADGFDLLARSGGIRATDSVELFPMPSLRDACCYQTYFYARAIRHLPAYTEERIARLQPDEPLHVMIDIDNPVQPNAIALRTDDRVIVGYLAGYLLDDAYQLFEYCRHLDVHVVLINPAPIPCVSACSVALKPAGQIGFSLFPPLIMFRLRMLQPEPPFRNAWLRTSRCIGPHQLKMPARSSPLMRRNVFDNYLDSLLLKEVRENIGSLSDESDVHHFSTDRDSRPLKQVSWRKSLYFR